MTQICPFRNIYSGVFLFCSFQKIPVVSGEWMRFHFVSQENLKHLSWDYEINQQAFNLGKNIKKCVKEGDKNGPVKSHSKLQHDAQAQYLIGIPLSNISS